MVSVLMTLIDLWPRLHGSVFLHIIMSKRCMKVIVSIEH